MKGALPFLYAKRHLVFFSVVLIAISFISGPAEAMFVPAAPQAQPTPLTDRATDLAKIQKALESKALQQRLVDYGLYPENALAKIDGLSDKQVHLFASHIDALQAGGMSDRTIIIILSVIVLLLLFI